MCKQVILQPGRENWQSLNMANCYQFAIGFRKDVLSNLMPGNISGYEIADGYKYSDNELVQLVKKDLSSLGYVVQECSEDPILLKGEWEICILNCSTEDWEYDFHFLGKFQNGETWFQKFAGEQLVESIDSPRCGNYDYAYRIVGYYKIKKAEE